MIRVRGWLDGDNIGIGSADASWNSIVGCNIVPPEAMNYEQT
jgi:hypothetical protein